MKETIYSPDVAGNKLLVEREFDAAPDQVWRAWTEIELLAEWWAPHPFKAITKTMDFKEGGHWHYYMLGPDGSKFWCMVNFLQVEPKKRFTVRNFFCDEEGNNTNELPIMQWENVFTPFDNGTKVTVFITFGSKEDMEKIISMGFKEGFSSAHKNLDELLKK